MSNEISFTFKAHTGYDAPWVTVKCSHDEPQVLQGNLADTVKLVGEYFPTVKTLAHDFATAQSGQSMTGTLDRATEAIQAAIPGSEVIVDEVNEAKPATPPVIEQSIPTCPQPGCGQPRTLREGRHPQSGEWSAYFCSSGNKDHTEFLRDK